MARYARIENGAVVETRVMPDNFDPAAVAHKGDFRIVNILPDPAFDPATQKLEGWGYVLFPEYVEAQRDVVQMTQQEQDDYAEAQDAEQERQLALSYYNDLRNGVGTNLERLVRLERVAARLIKDNYEL